MLDDPDGMVTIGQAISTTWPPPRRSVRHAWVIRQEESVVNDRRDVHVHDEEALAEIELTSDLMIAASEQEEHLTQEQVDEILGIVHP